MTVLYCASEAAPIAKIGGLGDVAGSLPKALQEMGVTAAVIIPHYETIDNAKWQISQIGEIEISYNKQPLKLSVSQTVLPNSDTLVFLLGEPNFIAGGGKSAFENSHSESERFAIFSAGIVAFAGSALCEQALGKVDLINCNDWHTSLVPLLLKQSSTPNIKTVLTIHNLSYQGIGPRTIGEAIGLEDVASLVNENGDINFLLQGIKHCDALTTVSESYAKEIVTEQFGAGLEGEILKVQHKLSGILNGIDYTLWNSLEDSYLDHHYLDLSKSDDQIAKQQNKAALRKKLELPKADLPIFTFIGRLDPNQKGIDLIVQWLGLIKESILREQVQVIILGTGDPAWEEKFKAMQPGNEQWLSVNMFFAEDLAHLLYAGSDYLLIPSKFEPCGLPQMIAQHYGTPPIVHEVGGLKDTVKDGVTGFSFELFQLASLHEKITEARKTYNTPDYWKMAKAGMEQDFSWHGSAKKYKALYESLAG